MTFVPPNRPPGVGEGDSRVADIAAARLLASTLNDLGEFVPPWVILLALGMTAPSTADEIDMLSGLTRKPRSTTNKKPAPRYSAIFAKMFGYQLERPANEPVDTIGRGGVQDLPRDHPGFLAARAVDESRQRAEKAAAEALANFNRAAEVRQSAPSEEHVDDKS